LVWFKCTKDLPDRDADVVNGAGGNLTQQMLELGKDLLDGVQVGRIFRQKDQLGAGRADEPANGFAFAQAGMPTAPFAPASVMIVSLTAVGASLEPLMVIVTS
jgi:hypothetical protein